MKFFSKVKRLFTTKTGKVIGFVSLGIGNVAAITITTVAWFNLSDSESKIKMVSGDLGVEVQKVTAYKYVYPYYAKSTEFIDYDSPGTIKKYILEDHISTYDSQVYDDISITSDDATVTLGTRFEGTSTNNSNSASSTNVYVPNDVTPEFRYYLIGDGLFCGVESSWSISDAYAFGLTTSVTENTHAIIDNVVVSAGASFALLDVTSQSGYAYNYFPISSIAESSSPFRILDSNEDGVGDTLLCLRSGIFTFTYSPNQLKIELRTSDGGQRKDVSVITNNSLDPTKISIDYAGSVDHETYATIESYVPTAIYNQNTTVVLDVQLNYKSHPNPIDAGLTVSRTSDTSNSIYNVTNRYESTTYNLNGYVDERHQNLLRASDFYNFYAKFTKTPYADTAAIWAALHRVGDNESEKFLNNGQSYERNITCTLHLKENDDSLLLPASASDSVYHCYIAIEYDYEHCASFFLNKNRLGKTYLLDRDFGFLFTGTQHRES